MNILVTGTNRGIGAGLKAELSARGHKVTGTHRSAQTEDTLTLDVTNAASANALSSALENEALDCLVCNAGVFVEKGVSFDDIVPEMWASTMAANVTGVFLTIRACLPALRRAPSGRIAIISSRMGSDAVAAGGNYVYRASKAAALNLGRNLAVDLKSEGIAVQIFHPGWVKTDMGGAEADLAMDEAIPLLATQIENIDLERTGAFLAYDGSAIPF